MKTEQRERPRRRPRLGLSPERWDRSKGLQQAIGVTFVISSLGALGNWYNWLHGTVSFYFPLVLTVVAAVALVLTPRRWQLLVMSASGILGLEILAAVLHKGPEGPLFVAMAVTAVLAGVFQYVRTKVERPPSDSEAQSPNETRP